MASLFPPPPGARGILVFSLVFSSSSFLTHCVAGLGSGPQGSSAPGTRQDLGSLGAVTSGMALAPGIRRPGLLPGCTGRAQPRPTWSQCQQSRHWESLVLRLEGLVQPCTEQAHRLQPESGLQARGEKGGSVPLCACPVRVHTHTRANTDSTHRHFQTQTHTHKHTDAYIHIYKYTLRHTQNTYIHRSFQTQTCTNTQVHTYTQIHANTPSTHTHHVRRRARSLPEWPIISSAGADPGKAGNAAQGGWAAGPAVWPPGSGSGV